MANTTARLTNAAWEPGIRSVAPGASARSKAAAGIATPSAEPTWRSELNTPAAIPASSARNPDRAVTVLATTPSAIGTPPNAATADTTTNGVEASKVAIRSAASSANARLQTMTVGAPMRATIAAARGNRIAARSGHGRSTSAASVGDRPRTSCR